MGPSMSATPRADFAAGCQRCGRSMETDSLDDVAWFYACHAVAGHDVEWLWGSDSTLTLAVEVSPDGGVRNLGAIVGSLDELFRPSRVPAELVFETCLNAGAEKATVERQLEALPERVARRVDPLD